MYCMDGRTTTTRATMMDGQLRRTTDDDGSQTTTDDEEMWQPRFGSQDLEPISGSKNDEQIFVFHKNNGILEKLEFCTIFVHIGLEKVAVAATHVVDRLSRGGYKNVDVYKVVRHSLFS